MCGYLQTFCREFKPSTGFASQSNPRDAMEACNWYVHRVVQDTPLGINSQLNNRRTQKIGILAIAIEGIHPERKPVVLQG